MERKRCCVTLSVQPSRGLVDEKFVVTVQKLQPGCQVTVHVLYKCEDGHSWEAFGLYTACFTGTVNVAEDPSLGGTYSGVEQMGLLWSLRPVPGSKPGLRMRKMNVQTPMEVTVSVYEGHRTEGFMDQVPLASVLVERWYMAPGVRRIPITEGGLTATLFLPPGPGPFPGLLDLWWGGGKLVEYRSALLASHGFACLVLDYLTSKFTMETGKMVGNDYFETAYRVLQQHPQVLGSRIAMLGLSLGTSFTLKMAVYSKVIKLRCAVCISGSHVLPVDGSVVDVLNLFDSNYHKTRVNEKNEVMWRDLLLPIPTDPKLKVDVGRLQCPLLVVVGEDDQNWATYESAMDFLLMGFDRNETTRDDDDDGDDDDGDGDDNDDDDNDDDDEGDDGEGWEQPPADCPFIPQCWSPDRASVHATCPGQQIQNSVYRRVCDGYVSVGWRDGGTFSRSRRRLEEDSGLSEGESVWWRCSLGFKSLTRRSSSEELLLCLAHHGKSLMDDHFIIRELIKTGHYEIFHNKNESWNNQRTQSAKSNDGPTVGTVASGFQYLLDAHGHNCVYSRLPPM